MKRFWVRGILLLTAAVVVPSCGSSGDTIVVSAVAAARLSGLALSSATFTPAFSPETTFYQVGARRTDPSIRVLATAADPGASIQVNGGAPSAPVLLAVGLNVIDVQVTSPAGDVLHYTILLVRDLLEGQSAYLKASNTDLGDFLGTAIAVSGDTLVVGAMREGSNATGVNAPLTGGSGTQDDNSLTQAGAAYVFRRTAGVWAQEAYLKASNTETSDTFGGSVAISGDTIVVGARFESSNATGVNAPLTGGSGTQDDNSLLSAGAAYVFRRTGTAWSQEAYLKASNTGGGDNFGTSVTIWGDTIVVGAPGEASNATGVNAPLLGGSGTQADDSLTFAGAAYVFQRTGTTWVQQAYLKASNTGLSDSFGTSVAVHEDTVVVGARGEASNATGVNAPLAGGSGTQADDSLAGAGAAYIFVRSAGVWSQQAYLKASNTGGGDQLGNAVAISGDTVAVAAVAEASNATGVNAPLTGGSGCQDDNSLAQAGAVYVFTRTAGVWSQQAYLKASNTNASDRFGQSVAIAFETIIVGANQEASNATGINAPLTGGSGAQDDNSKGLAGAAYVFSRTGTAWSQENYLKASNTDGGDRFGSSVGTTGEIFVVGGSGESSNATGVNAPLLGGSGTQADNTFTSAGAAYVYR